MKSLLKHPFLHLLLILSILEVFFTTIIDLDRHPRASEVHRNPTPKRFWVEYLDGPSQTDKKLIIIIGNSQAVGSEMSDPGDIYAALIKKSLENLGIDAVVENWAVGGIRTVDIELLTLKAVQRRATLILYILTNRNIDYEKNLLLDYPDSTINLIAGDISLFKGIRNTLFYANTSYHDLMIRYSMINSSLMRSRVKVKDRLARYFRPKSQKYLLGHVIRGQGHIDPLPSDNWKPKPRRYASTFRLKFTVEESQSRLNTLKKLHSNIRKALLNNKINYVWIWDPVSDEHLKNHWWETSDQEKEDCYSIYKEFRRKANDMIRADGGVAYDFTDAIGNEHFLNFGHLTKSGHEEMKNLLIPIITDELR